MTSAKQAYATAVLAIYVVLLLPILYIARKHGRQAMAWLSWGYLVVFCTLKIVGSALQMSDPNSFSAALISSIGLSPLTIAAGGILHEARYYTTLRNTTNTTTKRLETVILIIFHIIVATAIALTAVGASNLSAAVSKPTAPAQLNNDWNLAGAGATMLLLSVVAVVISAVLTLRSGDKRSGGRQLVKAVLVACPLLIVRMTGSVSFFFGQRLDMSPATGALGFRVGLYLVPEVLAVLALIVGGLLTRNIAREGEVTRNQEVNEVYKVRPGK